MDGPTPPGRTPPCRSEELLRHARTLRRVAVMLTLDRAHADRLVVAALRRVDAAPPAPATERWLVEQLAQAYVGTARGRPRETDRLTASLPVAGDDLLSGSVAVAETLTAQRPLARAATVLRLVEGWPARRVEDALGLPAGRSTFLVPRVDGVRTALLGAADQLRAESHELDGLVAAAQAATVPPARPGAADHGRPAGRRRAMRLLAAGVALALAGLWVWDARPGTGDQPSSPDRAHAVEHAAADLSGRGWVLDPAGEPPETLDGLRLLETTRIDLADAQAPIHLDTRPRSGLAVHAALWCDLPILDPLVEVPSLRLALAGEVVTLPCAGSRGEPPVRTLVPLPPVPNPQGVSAQATWTGDVPTRGTALLSTYTEVEGAPSVAGGADPATVVTTGRSPQPAAGAVALDAATPAQRVAGRVLHHARLVITPDTEITLWAGLPGPLSVQLDDEVVTDDGDLAQPPGAWRRSEVDLRGGAWLPLEPDATRTFAVPARLRPPAGEQREVTVLVTTSLPPGVWQVQLSRAEQLEDAPARLSLVTAETTTEAIAEAIAPAWIGGYRLAAAWSVPLDGRPHPLTDPGLAPGRWFVLAAPDVTASATGWGLVTPHVTTTRGSAPVIVVPAAREAFDASTWLPGERLVLTGASTGNVLLGTGTGVLQVTAPAVPVPGATGTLLAYEPVPYARFDQAAGTPMGASLPVGSPSAPEDGWKVLGRWTRTALDREGVLELDVLPPRGASLRLTTQGPGRVRVLESGRPAVWLADGWWSAWTAEHVVTEVPLSTAQGSGGRPLTLVVEGYERDLVVELLAPPQDTDANTDTDADEDTAEATSSG